MPFVRFLKKYETFEVNEVVDIGRFAHASTLVRQGIANWESDAGDIYPTFSQDTPGLATGPTASDISSNLVLRADGDWVTNGSAFTGTAGSVVFVGADTMLTEDNDKLFFDDTNDYLGINMGTSPLAHLHIEGDTSTDNIVEVRRTNAEPTAHSLFVGPAGSTPDFAVWGDGRCGINVTEATNNAMLRIEESSSGGPETVLALQQDNTSGKSIIIDHNSITGKCVEIAAAEMTTSTVLDIACSGLTSGTAIAVVSNSASVVNRSLVSVLNQHASATGAIPLVLQQLSTGYTARFNYSLNATDISFGWNATGYQSQRADQTTDTAPLDDNTLKKWSIQRRLVGAGDPTNAAFIKLSNSPDTNTAHFYLVLEEG